MSMMWIAFLLSNLVVPTIKPRKDRPQSGDALAGADPAETGAACEDAIAAI
jgi:hypothetical protein